MKKYFYENWDFSEFELFSRLKDEDTRFLVSEPAEEVIESIKNKKENRLSPLNVAELGVGYGATSLQICLSLSKGDTYYCFDFEDVLSKLKCDLTKIKNIVCDIKSYGADSSCVWDSYNWALSDLVLSNRENKEKILFDVVYLDGAHTLLHDGLAVCILKELISVGGILILDDRHWFYDGNEWGQSFFPTRMTPEQAKDKQIWRVERLFLKNDPNFLSLTSDDSWYGIYEKKQ